MKSRHVENYALILRVNLVVGIRQLMELGIRLNTI
jgi:hypothetical protein